jgi:hypothetical protein
MGMKKILTDERLASIPELIAQGLNKKQIAEQFGCRYTTLQVVCSRRGISLRPLFRRPRSPPGPYKKVLRVDSEIMKMYRLEAEAKDVTTKSLVEKLLTIIVTDNLIDAVLDEEVA